MTPKAGTLSAAELQERYGAMLCRSPYSDCRSPLLLHQAISERPLRLKVSMQTCKTWFAKYRIIAVGNRIDSASSLEQRHGDLVRYLALEHPTTFKLSQAILKRELLCVSNAVAEGCLRSHDGREETVAIECEDQLERHFGDRIRQRGEFESADSMALWLHTELKIRVPKRICRVWIEKAFNEDGRMRTIQQIEKECGDMLRRPLYAYYFEEGERVHALVRSLRAVPPRRIVTAALLRQWYSSYHPKTGPLRFDTATQLEEALGEEMREVYREYRADQYKQLRMILGRRLKTVKVSSPTLRTWYRNYGGPAMATSAAGACRKRSAAVAGLSMPPARKRPTSANDDSTASGAYLDDDESFRAIHMRALAFESSYGPRYRREVIEKGLDADPQEMRRRLRAWGAEETLEVCAHWLRVYRFGKFTSWATAGTCEVARLTLQRWYHVDGLRGEQLRQKYRDAHGVHDENCMVEKWLSHPDQALPFLEKNEALDRHPAGDFVLELLQSGISTEEASRMVLKKYLVRVQPRRLRAYRHYREDRTNSFHTKRHHGL